MTRAPFPAHTESPAPLRDGAFPRARARYHAAEGTTEYCTAERKAQRSNRAQQDGISALQSVFLCAPAQTAQTAQTVRAPLPPVRPAGTRSRSRSRSRAPSVRPALRVAIVGNNRNTPPPFPVDPRRLTWLRQGAVFRIALFRIVAAHGLPGRGRIAEWVTRWQRRRGNKEARGMWWDGGGEESEKII